jgi:hypothetical protein
MPLTLHPLRCRATLPALEELQLQSANLVEPRGPQLLRQLVCGSGGTLRELRLAGSNLSSLGFLSEATSLTHLDLAGGAEARTLWALRCGKQARAIFGCRAVVQGGGFWVGVSGVWQGACWAWPKS